MLGFVAAASGGQSYKKHVSDVGPNQSVLSFVL